VTTRVLAISGSLRQASHNTQLLRLAQEHAPHGVEISIWEGLADLPAYNEDLEVDPGEVVEGLRAAIAGADALLIATPEYNFGVPGALKNALDWASRPYGASALTGVPTAVIGASPSSFMAVQARGDLRRALALSGAIVDDETTGFHAERLTSDPEAVAAEVVEVVRALTARVGVAA
jgi:chromate reductase, NAD(P)H dehydrogenase (quinone)